VSVVLEDEPEVQTAAPVAPRADSLAASVVILLIMTLAQRLLGFGRGVMFCRWLQPEELGQWDIAFAFLNLGAPLAVLGLPGSFGRYVEYFRHHGQFRTFLRRAMIVCVTTSIVAAVVMVYYRDWFAELIFDSVDKRAIIPWLAACLMVVAMHNCLTALFIAVRRYRIVTAIQFFQSLGFAVISLGLLAVWPVGATSCVIGYGAATALSAVGTFGCVRRLTDAEPADSAPIGQRAFWAKLVPFAAWMWVTNLLANLFEVIDRYMIVHHSGLEVTEAWRQVGYYHSSRIVPLLFVAVAGLLGSMITPHLSLDWHLGRHEAVVRQLNKVLKLLLLTLFTASIGVLFVAPVLFTVAFENKFEGGLIVLPWTLAYCAWFGTIAVAQNYLWCAERPGLNSLALLAGVLLNIGFNLLLLPRYGLEGAVWATSLANLVSLVLIYLFSRRQGMRIDRGTWLLTLAPLALGCGIAASLIVLAALLCATATTSHVLTSREKRQVVTSLRGVWQRIRNSLIKFGFAAAPAMASGPAIDSFGQEKEEF